jgi:hypothetical protein
MPRNYKLLTRLLVGVLKHQVKKHLGEDVLAVLGEVGSDHLGERLLDLLSAEVATGEFAKKLVVALQSAADELQREQGGSVQLRLEDAPTEILEAVVDALASLETSDLLGRRLQSSIQNLVAAIAGTDADRSLLISMQLYQAVLMAVLTIPELQPRAHDLLLQSRIWVLSEQIRRIELLARQRGESGLTLTARALPIASSAATPVRSQARLAAAREVRAGLTVAAGRIELLKPLGKGGLGAVWLGRRSETGETVAVKFLNSDLNSDSEIVSVFQREARTVVALPSSAAPKIVDPPTYEDGLYFYVMEYLADFTSFEQLIKDGDVPVVRRLEIITHVAGALHTLHQQGVIHGDVKPANILVSSHDEVRLIDFGAARTIGDESIAPLTFTYAYAAPELLASDAREREQSNRATVWLRCATPALDVYPLGVMVVQAVDPGLWQIAHGDALSLVGRLVIGPELKAVIRRAITLDPDRRFPSALALKAAMESALSGIVPWR